MRLRLSPNLSWHARGDAAYAWHLRTGDVCEMSRDVVALCLAFADGADVDAAVAATAIPAAQAREFVAVLHGRDLLVDEGAGELALARRRPCVPRHAVFETVGDDVVVYGRATSLRVEDAARALARADGTRPLGEVAPRRQWEALVRLCAPDVAALKLLPPGTGVPSWAQSTMPWPAIDPRAFVDGKTAAHDPSDMTAYHAAIGDATAQFEEVETTLSHLFREPHRALGGERFGTRLARALVARGVPAAGVCAVETGGGLGWVGRALVDALHPARYLVVDRSPSLARAQRARGLVSVVGDALRLPLADGSIDLLISNEMAGDLGSDDTANHGALALVDEIARVLAPGGLAYVSEFGHPTAPPRRSDHLDHDEYSLRFGDLASRARGHGLETELVQVPELVGLDGSETALVTTRASFAALRNLFRAHGSDLAKRAWLVDELEAHARVAGVDLARVHGVVTAPLGQRTMGLVPSEFWALIARRRKP